MTTANTKGKYHISEDGVARKCQAEVKPCKYTTGDGADSHYDTREQAQAAYEQQRQNASVTASRKKSGKAKSNQHASKPLKDRIGELNAEADEFRANIIRLRKSIEKDIEREMERINNISRIKSEIALDELKAKGKALFQNVDDAAAFYNLAWELGNSPAYDGDREVSKAIASRFDADDTYIMDNALGGWQHKDDYTQCVKGIHVAIPRPGKLEDDMLAKTADEVDPIVRTNAQIMGGETHIRIREDTLSAGGAYAVKVSAENDDQDAFSYQLVKTTHGFTRPVEDKRSQLSDALNDVSRNCHYSYDTEDEDDNEYDDDDNWNQWG